MITSGRVAQMCGYGVSLIAGALMSAALVAPAVAQDSAPVLDRNYPNYQPPYPDAAQVNGEQGNVVLNVQISTSGKVRGVQVAQSSGFEDLDNAAIAGVWRWRYVPAVEDGDTITAWTTVTIHYQLPRAILVPPDAPAPKQSS